MKMMNITKKNKHYSKRRLLKIKEFMLMKLNIIRVKWNWQIFWNRMMIKRIQVKLEECKDLNVNQLLQKQAANLITILIYAKIFMIQENALLVTHAYISMIGVTINLVGNRKEIGKKSKSWNKKECKSMFIMIVKKNSTEMK